MRIDEIMKREPESCAPGDLVQEVALKMKYHDCGLIPVVEENGVRQPVGVITDRDIACRLVAAGKVADQTRVEEIMTREVITVNYQASFNAAIRLMEGHGVRRLVVTQGSGGLIGVLSLTDLARAVGRDRLGKLVQSLSANQGGSEGI